MYSLELEYTFRTSRVIVDKNVARRTLNLKIRNYKARLQGTLNVLEDRQLNGRLKAAKTTPISVLRVEILLFVLLLDIPMF